MTLAALESEQLMYPFPHTVHIDTVLYINISVADKRACTLTHKHRANIIFKTGLICEENQTPTSVWCCRPLSQNYPLQNTNTNHSQRHNRACYNKQETGAENWESAPVTHPTHTDTHAADFKNGCSLRLNCYQPACDTLQQLLKE